MSHSIDLIGDIMHMMYRISDFSIYFGLFKVVADERFHFLTQKFAKWHSNDAMLQISMATLDLKVVALIQISEQISFPHSKSFQLDNLFYQNLHFLSAIAVIPLTVNKIASSGFFSPL